VNRIALLGAGFSPNRGAPLAAEVMGDVLGRIAEDRDPSSLVRSLLNFEDALVLVQRQFDSSRNDGTKRKLDRMQVAILDTFRGINQAFVDSGQMEFSQDARDSIQTYLSRLSCLHRAVVAHAVSREKQ
jgi:hypothetical protein